MDKDDDEMPLANIDPEFLARCKVAQEDARLTSHRPSLRPPPSLPASEDVDADPERARFLDNYADAFTDTRGVVGGAPFIYKSGRPWPKPDDPEARPYVRVVRAAAHTHPIAPVWEGIVIEIEAYLEGRGIESPVIAGLSYGNARDKKAFCELAVVIGVPPVDFKFDDIKSAADHIKSTIIDPAGFPDVPVAFREWESRMHTGTGAKLPALDPLVDGEVAEFRHPFTSTLGLSVALERKPHIEGTIGLFLRRSRDSDDILALTCAHVVYSHSTRSLSVMEAAGYHERVIALGVGGYRDGVNNIKSRIATLNDIVTTEQDNIRQIDSRLATGTGNSVVLGPVRRRAERGIDRASEAAEDLNALHNNVTKYLTLPEDRLIGRVLCADAICPSSEASDAHTVDWAAIEIRKDAFKNDEFLGNTVWIGSISKERYCNHMWPNPRDRKDYGYPRNGLLQIRGSASEEEMHKPKELDVNGDPRMPVIKNGRATGTTMGWLNGLRSRVRNCLRLEDGVKIVFKSFETTFVGNGDDAFSDGGDSGSAILNRDGDVVAILTSGGGLNKSTDITFGTPWYQLFPHIKKVMPDCFLLPAVAGN